MADLREKVRQEVSARAVPGKKRDSKVLTFVIIMVVVFGLMVSFLLYTNQNLEPVATTPTGQTSTR